MIALITPPTVSPALARNYNSLFASGLDALIIRMPGADRSDYEAVVAAIEPKWRHLLLVDNYYDLTQTASVGGIHLNKARREGFCFADTRGLRISTSTHSLEELEHLPFKPQFALLSPVYDSICKAGYKANVPLEECTERLLHLSFPVLALGGITPERAKEVMQYGFSGAAAMGYFFDSGNCLLERFLAFPRNEALTIAGHDPSSGAGMIADVLNMEHLGVFPLSVVTVCTVQHEEEFKSTYATPLEKGLEAATHLLTIHKPIAAKIALTEEIADVAAYAKVLRAGGVKRIVWDPVIKPTQGDIALHASPERKVLQTIAPLIDLITPNLPEAEALFGSSDPAMVQQAARELGVAVLLKGGHSADSAYCSTDTLFLQNGHFVAHSIPKAPSTKHGTGCALSSAITAFLSRGFTLTQACRYGQQYVETLLRSSDRLFMERNDRMQVRKERALRTTHLMYITDASDTELVLKQAEAALQGGVRWIQLRMKEASHENIVTTARKLKTLMAAYEEATLIINDDVEAVLESGADGVHLGLSDTSIGEARKRLGINRIIGGTCNTAQNLHYRTLEGADYVGVGPWHFTRTKTHLSPMVTPENLEQIITSNTESVPLFVIGGITAIDIEALGRFAINGVAVSGAINKAKNISLSANQLTTLSNKHFNRNL